jgi:hypothetical protein
MGQVLTSCPEMSHLSNETVSVKLHQTAQADWAELLQKQKTSLPHRLLVAWTRV